MPNFTINSLNSANTSASDQFLKSDTSGVLTKTSGQDLANDLVALAGLTPVVKTATLTFGSATVPATFYKIGRVVVICLIGPSAVTDATINNWVTVGTVPDGIGAFSNCGISLPDGKQIMVRNNAGNLQLQTKEAAFWAQGTGVALASA